ncbi:MULTISPECIES: acetyl/propionyl/methylcrotonyl-CoA carboxylase subunit alpha [unclassified Pseudomonas]|uniref:acetyl/propionyl/methylcrotonyl-CoA carboxylase subunit alpha n=1 Tax=unclassified Pseudomonas TaxID=196821 RepID=UPI0002A33B4B|nr:MULTISPECIES: acetyl/propionyl/methylcrotonyl-CoA carboxylase subunit alpha [unclassified Pseudomonas]MBB1607438.1 3-methylcrotonyl-CoA carboxylase [Pseudomonas sp. UMC76]MBB1637030.1 3-methylcrotonyl-CoA carboxylase [Pseudomonas sp. UME83]NTX91343.1 acetyl/propionyl/methylcrotonyl-CoA carboxylase subunit alpha [Pseudomonas sp. UMA643]NTY20546.1 acetyl/propionyl/methylcrotonyl-CoA carboxylase subunit alpha [Pseudomonas sp. UMC3103]NTY27014.1 acetyl/propionyl/methylcrotonyl-CoA carboxylase s
MITTLLVANRGEIACRVMRTAKALGLTTVAVHSATDRHARHVEEADIAIDLGGAKPAESYLRADAVLAAAKAAGAQAIHPGYGFLSENAGFARACEEAGLVFLGPPASAIDAMGSKSAAKALMEDAGVPLVPGYHGEAQDYPTFQREAARIGYPVLLKAAAGGGGKGMKVVERESELAEALESAQREAQSGFGDSRMLVEKYLTKPRHVEIQVFADKHGNCLYLNERDCSIQRRHQKVVEEAPAPGLSVELRRGMGEAAVRAAQAIGYVGAGTVEFLYDEGSGQFFFMEMNTRLQVEHPVTEAITGLDLVAWQIRVARGEPLPITQEQVPLNGHAIEVRLYAEDPEGGFLPASGHLALYREPPAGPGRRVDSGIREGDDISPFYDPMLAKLIAWGENREEARQRLLAMLGETAVGGFKTNLAFLRRVLAHPAFAAAELDTGFIARHQEQLLPAPGELPPQFWQLAGEAWAQSEAERVRNDDAHSPWSARDGWRSGLPGETDLHLLAKGESQVVRLRHADGVRGATLKGEWLEVDLDGLRRRHLALRQGDSLYLEWQGELVPVRRYDAIAEAEAAHAHHGGLGAPMNGSIVRILVQPGQTVEAGAALVVLEAMKMEHSIRAPHAGVVKSLYCSEGELVAEGTALVELEEASA